MMTIFFYLLAFIASVVNLVLGSFNVDLIPVNVHNSLRYIGSLIAPIDVWIPGLLPMLFEKLEWLIWVLIAMFTYDIIARWLKSRKI